MDLSAYCRPVGNHASSTDAHKKRSFLNIDYGDDQNNDNNPDGDDQPKAELKRKCIDYHTPAVIDISSRLYRKSNRRSHVLPGGSGMAVPYMQCHGNYLKWMGLPLGDMAGHLPCSTAFLTYCAHVTRAKNSNPVM